MILTNYSSKMLKNINKIAEALGTVSGSEDENCEKYYRFAIEFHLIGFIINQNLFLTRCANSKKKITIRL